MKRILTILIIIMLFAIKSSAQINFRNESGSHPINDEKLEKEINKNFKIPQNNELEFRLYTLPTLTTSSSLFVMRLNNKIWEAHLFRKNHNSSWVAEDVDNNGLDNLWSKLDKNQVLTLPDQEDIKDKMKIFKADTTAVLEDWGHMQTQVMDGVIYHFELTQYNYCKRAYSYHCPYTYLQKYPNIEELYRAYAIIILVYKHLGMPLSVC